MNSQPAVIWQSVKGHSMWPALKEGDQVALEWIRRPVLPGEVVVVRTGPGDYVIHRVVSVVEGAVTTQGDACLRADPPRPKTAVLFTAFLRQRGNQVTPIPKRGGMWRRIRLRLAEWVNRTRFA